MAPVSGTQLLAALDGAADEVHQAMAVLRVAGLDPSTMTLGAGDRALLDLTDEVGGPIEITATCGTCRTCAAACRCRSDRARASRPTRRARWAETSR